MDDWWIGRNDLRCNHLANNSKVDRELTMTEKEYNEKLKPLIREMLRNQQMIRNLNAVIEKLADETSRELPENLKLDKWGQIQNQRMIENLSKVIGKLADETFALAITEGKFIPSYKKQLDEDDSNGKTEVLP